MTSGKRITALASSSTMAVGSHLGLVRHQLCSTSNEPGVCSELDIITEQHSASLVNLEEQYSIESLQLLLAAGLKHSAAHLILV